MAWTTSTWTSESKDLYKIFQWGESLKLDPMFVASFNQIAKAREDPTSLLYQCEFAGCEHWTETEICETIQDYLLK